MQIIPHDLMGIALLQYIITILMYDLSIFQIMQLSTGDSRILWWLNRTADAEACLYNDVDRKPAAIKKRTGEDLASGCVFKILQ